MTYLMASLFFFVMSLNLSTAQDDVNYYFAVDYMKVKPSNFGDYEKLEKVWKKIHKARIKAGTLDGWFFDRIASPAGTNAEYDYITVNRYKGENQMAGHYEESMMPDKLESPLTAEEIELVSKTASLRDIVKQEMWTSVDGTWAEDMTKANVLVFNYFRLKPGKTLEDHEKVEIDVWKPLHTARIEANQMLGWGLYNMVFPQPHGTNVAYHSGTVDVYTDMKQFMTPNMMSLVEKVHPGKSVDEILKKTNAVADLLSAEVRMRIDYVVNDNGQIMSAKE